MEIMSNIRKKKWIDSKTGDMYDLSHTTPTIFEFGVKLSRDAEIEKIQVKVFFSNHCYSRECFENDPVHFREEKRNGTVENRTFCVDRWEFSKKLPRIISELGNKTCLQGGQKEVLYRLEDSDPVNPSHGWYLCMRMGYRPNKIPSIELSVRSIHWRSNRPIDIRGGSQRFYVLLSKLIKQHA